MTPRSLLFFRSPSLPTRVDVIAYLAARGCTRIEAHLGPDGEWRGSGTAETTAPVTVAREGRA